MAWKQWNLNGISRKLPDDPAGHTAPPPPPECHQVKTFKSIAMTRNHRKRRELRPAIPQRRLGATWIVAPSQHTASSNYRPLLLPPPSSPSLLKREGVGRYSWCVVSSCILLCLRWLVSTLPPWAHLHVVGMLRLRFFLHVNQPNLLTPFYSVLVSVSVSTVLSTVFHSIHFFWLSHSVLPFLVLSYWSFQLCTSLYESLPNPPWLTGLKAPTN